MPPVARVKRALRKTVANPLFSNVWKNARNNFQSLEETAIDDRGHSGKKGLSSVSGVADPGLRPIIGKIGGDGTGIAWKTAGMAEKGSGFGVQERES